MNIYTAIFDIPETSKIINMNTLGRAALRTMISPENQQILNLDQDDGANAHIEWMEDIAPENVNINALAPAVMFTMFTLATLTANTEDFNNAEESAAFWEEDS